MLNILLFPKDAVPVYWIRLLTIEVVKKQFKALLEYTEFSNYSNTDRRLLNVLEEKSNTKVDEADALDNNT